MDFRFPDFRFLEVRKYILFLLTNLAYNALNTNLTNLYKIKIFFKKMTFRSGLKQRCPIFCRNLRINHENLWICAENKVFSSASCLP